jgi:hypothetical protein
LKVRTFRFFKILSIAPRILSLDVSLSGDKISSCLMYHSDASLLPQQLHGMLQRHL